MPVEQKMQFTLALIKSRAIEQGHGDNLRHAMAQMPGISVVAEIYAEVMPAAFDALYEAHWGASYYDHLHESVTSPHSAQVFVLKGNNVINRWRLRCGATDPTKADKESLRYKFGLNMPHNATHGSDSPDSARREIAIFFPYLDLSEMVEPPTLDHNSDCSVNNGPALLPGPCDCDAANDTAAPAIAAE